MVQPCVDYNCQDDTLGTFHENECGVEYLGNHNKAIIFGCNSTTTDFEDAVQILADIAADRAWRITGAKFTINEATFQEQDSPVPCKPKSVTGFDQDGDYENPNVNADNDPVHSLLFSAKSFKALMINECDSDDRVKFIGAEIKFKGSVVSQPNAIQIYKGKYSWRNVQVTTLTKQPGVFD
jgi:hypothetical protein